MKTTAYLLGIIFLALFAANAFAQATVQQNPIDYTYYGYPTDYPLNYILKNKFQLSGPAMFDFRFLSRYIPNGKPNILEEGVCVDDACYCKVRYGLHDNTSHVLPRDYQIYITHHNSASDYSAPRGSHKGLYMDCGQSVYPPNPYYPGERKPPYVPQAYTAETLGSKYGTPVSWSVAYDYAKNLLKQQPQSAYTYQQFYGYGNTSNPQFNQYTRQGAYDWGYPINTTYSPYQTGRSYQGPTSIGDPLAGAGGYRTTYRPGYTYPYNG